MRCGLVIVCPDEADKSKHSLLTLGMMTELAVAESIKLEITVIEAGDLSERHRMLDAAATGVDCLFFYGHVDRTLLAHAESLGVPTLLLGNIAGDPVAPVRFGHIVTTDHVAAGQFATRSLLEAGHQRIGFFISTTPQGLWYERCLAGYRHAHLEAGITPQEGMVQLTGPGGLVGHKAAEAYCQLDALPTAYVCPDLDNAKQFIDAMQRAGHRIDPATMVVCGAKQHPLRDAFSNHPLVLEDLRLLIKTSLNLLRNVATRRTLTTSKLLIPFETHNFPVATSPA